MTREQALNDSIEHWRRMEVNGINGPDTPRGKECALCALYYNTDNDPTCEGCPVYDRTGLEQCFETPYHSAVREFFYGKNQKFKASATRMRKFLESLKEPKKE